MLNFLLFDGAKLLCNNHNAKKKHFARLAKEDYNLFRVGLQPTSYPSRFTICIQVANTCHSCKINNFHREKQTRRGIKIKTAPFTS